MTRFDIPENDYPDEPDDALDRVQAPEWKPLGTIRATAKVVPFSMVEPSGDHAPTGPDTSRWDALNRPPLPDGNPKTAQGVKKPGGMHCTPPVALMELGKVMASGAAKYGPFNWRTDSITFSTYYNAMMRHAYAMLDGQWIDPESGAPHAAHMMACAAILIDAERQGMLNDDRPSVSGQSANYILGNTK
jgi:hypothetical protein